MATWNGSALHSLGVHLGRVANPDPTPLLLRWCKIIEEDNRRGLLAGTDKDGKPMAKVTYRPKKTGAPLKWGAKHQSKLERRSAHTGAHNESAYNNLTSAQYRSLAGPPLVPRGARSRLITNLYLAYMRAGPAVWRAVGAWATIVSAKGVAFMPYHFDGIGQKQRDPRGVRPWGRKQAVAALTAWAKQVTTWHRVA